MLESLPASAEELVVALDREFPHKCVEPGDTLEQANRYAGKREMVDWLLGVMEETREQMLMNQS